LTERYTIERKLGEGASASVFLATDTMTGEKVAIKRALEIMSRHARFAGRWQREVIVLQTLQHPRIVPLLDATFAKGKPLTMVMKVAEGDLEGRLTEGCTGKEALHWLYQTLEGLVHIHSFGGHPSRYEARQCVDITRWECLVSRFFGSSNPC